MGAIHLQSGVFPQALQREVEELEQEADGELQAIGLRSLAARLERSQPQASIQIYDLLAASPKAPEAHRDVARARLAALQGQGSGGARWEAMIGRFAGEATDYRTILPMMLASSVAGLVKVAALGRLSSSVGWFSRGLGARVGSNALAFAAEVPTFSLSGRALQAWSGEKSSAPLGQELAASALSLACLKGFVGVGAKLSPKPLLSTAFFAPASLYTAHGIEERLGWRPASDSTSRAADAIAASLSLSVGARLGGQLLGENFARRQSEFLLRGELALNRPLRLREWRMPGLPEPLLMSAGDNAGEGKAPEALGEISIGGEAFGKREVFSRNLRQYREYFGLTLMGDLLRNIEGRLAASSEPLRVLDIGPGDSSVVGELKQRFGDRLAIESRDQNFLTVDLHERRYDLVLALLGAGSQPSGRLSEVLDKAVDHLDTGGELAVFLSSQLLRGPDALNWRRVENLSVTRAGLDQGLALRFEKVPGGHTLYGQRLEPWRKVPLQEIFKDPQVPPLPPETQSYFEKGLRDQTMRAGGHEWRLDSSSAARLAQTLVELGQRNALIVFPNLAQVLMDRFLLAFHKDHHRLPAAHEIQNWIDGREPSALHSKNLFIDEWLRLQSERSGEARKRSNPLPGLLGLGIGLSAFFGESKAWAFDTIHGAAGGNIPAYAIPAAASLIVLGGLLFRHLNRGMGPRSLSNFELSTRESAYFDKVLTKQFAGRFRFESDLKKGANWILQTLLHFYVGESKSGRDPFNPVGDRLILRSANFDPDYVSRLQPRHQAMLDKVRNRQQAQMDESGLMVWTRSTEPDNSADEITLPGAPKGLGPAGPKRAITLGVGALAMLSPQVAEAADSAAQSGNFDWRIGAGAVGLSLLGVYVLGRWVAEMRAERRSVFLMPVPSHLSLVPPMNEQDPYTRDNVLYFPGMPDAMSSEVEVLDSRSGARWYKVGEPLKPGWVKEERKKIFGLLSRPTFQQWERELALNNLITRMVRSLRRDSEVGEAAKLMWDLSVSPKSGPAGRNWLKAAYTSFINSPLFFEVGSPAVYRESLRLRRIFSDPENQLKVRIDAVEAYYDLFRKFDLGKPLARAESRMALDSLADFLAEDSLVRGTRTFMRVNGAALDIDSKLFLWRSGQKNGLKAGNEDWEGNY